MGGHGADTCPTHTFLPGVLLSSVKLKAHVAVAFVVALLLPGASILKC